MIKNYTDKEYSDKAVEANSKGLSLYILVTPTEFTGTDEQGQPTKYTEDVATLVLAEEGYYVTYDGNYTDGTINDKLDEEKAQAEAERIAMLSLTRGDVFRGLLLAKSITKEQIATMIEAMPTSNQEEIVAKELAKIDFEDALNFYRGNSLIDTIGLALGITKEQLDKFFETGDYKELM